MTARKFLNSDDWKKLEYENPTTHYITSKTLKGTLNFANEYGKKLLLLHGVIDWVAVKDRLPIKKQEVIIYSEKYGSSIVGYNSPAWKLMKPTHWADTKNIKPPCV